MVSGLGYAGDNEDSQRYRLVTVSGAGEIQVVPDRAIVNLGMESRQPKMETARKEVNKVVEAFLEYCDELDVPKKQIKTASLNVRPEYDWNNQTRERRLRGYFVSRQLTVELKDLDKLGPLMEGSVSLGVNQSQAPTLDVSDRNGLRRDALKKAAEDARLNAEVLAKTLGARVGKIRRISASDVGFRPPVVRQMNERALMRSSAADSGASPESYEVGKVTVNASVQAEFDLLVD